MGGAEDWFSWAYAVPTLLAPISWIPGFRAKYYTEQVANEKRAAELAAATALAQQAADLAAEEARQSEGIAQEKTRYERTMRARNLGEIMRSRPGPSTTPLRGQALAAQQAKSFVTTMKSRYPAAFEGHPQYERVLEGQILGAILAPSDPADPLHVQRVMGSLEYEIALEAGRIRPQPTQAEAQVARPDISKLPSLASYRATRRGQGRPRGF
jgi:hypothetical protein